MYAFGRLNRFMLGSLAVTCAALLGCRGEQSTAPHMVPTPSGMMHDLGTVIVDVDLVHHTIKTHPVTSAQRLPPGVSARFFGTKTQIEYALSEGPFNDFGGGPNIQ